MDQQHSYLDDCDPLHTTNYLLVPQHEGSGYTSDTSGLHPESETYRNNIPRTAYSGSSGASEPLPSIPLYSHPYASINTDVPTTDFGTELQYPEQGYQDVQIHAPIPISSYSTLIPSPVVSNVSANTSTSRAASGVVCNHRPTPLYSRSVEASQTLDSTDSTPFEHFTNSPLAAQPVPFYGFLNNEGSRDRQASVSPERARSVSITSEEEDGSLPAAAPPRPARRKGAQKKVDNQRKAYFRGVAQNVGFESTDPDSITSHDKKRHYLESLEHYVLWLHEQSRLVGVEPPPLERILSSKGLDIRSVRTLLLHMQDESKKANTELLEEQQSFVLLRQELLTRGLSVETQEGEDLSRRHSIASGAIPAMASLQPPTL
ncbi:hypothetical protein K474DRAFT_1704792 [Panus rudis PR-1116 ss-1]|nr:hypothetical protein K474DRAFT_1704792 [Panus rudis PR-1116 ss-1]